jgi:predicted DNA-binding protein (MmcQ/YjbR family)
MINRSEIFDHAEKKFNASPDYPFEKYPQYAVLRRADNGKWFGLIMNVSRDKLGLRGDGEVDVLDIKCHPATVGGLRSAPGFLPAYHMNKEHWLSVVLDGSVSKKEVLALLDESHHLTK